MARQPERHIRVRVAGMPPWDFRATITQARVFAASMRRYSGVFTITVDDNVNAEFPALPNARLFSYD